MGQRSALKLEIQLLTTFSHTNHQSTPKLKLINIFSAPTCIIDKFSSTHLSLKLSCLPQKLKFLPIYPETWKDIRDRDYRKNLKRQKERGLHALQLCSAKLNSNSSRSTLKKQMENKGKMRNCGILIFPPWFTTIYVVYDVWSDFSFKCAHVIP